MWLRASALNCCANTECCPTLGHQSTINIATMSFEFNLQARTTPLKFWCFTRSSKVAAQNHTSSAANEVHYKRDHLAIKSEVLPADPPLKNMTSEPLEKQQSQLPGQIYQSLFLQVTVNVNVEGNMEHSILNVHSILSCGDWSHGLSMQYIVRK